MPRTGPASELIKQIMGLLMLAASAYFVGVGLSGMLVSPPEPPSRLYLWVVAAFVISAGGWLLYRTLQIARRTANRAVFGALGALLVAIGLGGGFMLTAKGPIDWVYYTPERFADAQRAGNTVVMEFTAEWCLNCKALESTVLSHPSVARLLAEDGVTPIKVDITNYELGNQMLSNVGRISIPLLVVFAPDGREVFKGDFYTVEQVIAAVRDAQGRQVATRGSP
jgi:thiol:disulfide interchange protein DsbD